MKWFPLCNYTHYSLQLGFSKPDQLAAKCSKNTYRACGIADYKSISGAVAFYKACISNKIKPIIGCSFDGFSLFAKNHQGWLDLIEIVSGVSANGDINNTSLLTIANRNNLICIAKNEAMSPVTGSDFYQKTDLFLDTYYVEKSQAELHRILLCSAMKDTLPNIRKNIATKQNKIENSRFFESDDFYLKDCLEINAAIISDTKISIFDEIYEKCEQYNILNKPMLPKFQTPNNIPENEYLRQLADKGYNRLLKEKIQNESSDLKYRQRFENEYSVIESANLFGYFLIVHDILDYCRKQGWEVGPGRGSAAGCLISYLMGITQIDPMEYDLLFERFYNVGRNTGDHISLPDIDIDVPAEKRDQIIAYLKNKYGVHNVSQMITFGRLQGRSAITEVLRANNACGFQEMKEITKHIPDEARISDQLAEMDDDERSIIRWALLNNQEDLKDYCVIEESGELKGEYAKYFQQAIEMEGTFRNQGKHAAGVVISAQPLHKICPMTNQKHGDDKIAGLEMEDLEALGHVKFDLLGLTLLDKIMKIQSLTRKTIEE